MAIRIITHRSQILSKGQVRERQAMNKTESAYALWLKADPGVESFCFEVVGLRLSDPPKGSKTKAVIIWPDFLVLMKDGTTFIDEVKGDGKHNDASIVRIKLAAERFPLWTFRLCVWERRRNWKITVL